MFTIGWSLFVLVLMVGTYLQGVSIGLLSGLGLMLLTFFKLVQPTSPPNELIILQSAWMIFIATLEAVFVFDFLKDFMQKILVRGGSYAYIFVPLLSYLLAFCTGDRKWVCTIPTKIGTKNSLRLRIPMTIAAHMAVCISPLSISGMLLLWVMAKNQFPTLQVISIMGGMTLILTGMVSIAMYVMPEQFLVKLEQLLTKQPSLSHSKENIGSTSTKLNDATYSVVLLLLSLLSLVLFTTQWHSTHTISVMGSIMSVRLPMFFILMLLSTAAILMLYFDIKPISIIQSHRFRWHIQDFFVFLGLTWFAETLINNDKAYLIQQFSSMSMHPPFYIFLGFYILTIPPPLIIWLLLPLLIECGVSVLGLALFLVLLQICSGLICLVIKKLHPIHLPNE